MKIGIDIGTSTSSVCVDVDGEKHLIKCGTGAGATERHIPTAIYLKEDGSILIGQAAEQNKMRNPQRFVKSFKRDLGQKIPLRLGEKDFLPEQLIEQVIGHLKVCAEKSDITSDEKITEATICHPANFSQYKKDLLTKAAVNAGIDNVELMDEPTAAAHYYYYKDKIQTGETLLIYDLGGGTFDISLMKKTDEGLELLTRPLGIEKCGGDDFNYAIYEYIAQDEATNLEQIKSMITDKNMLNIFESNLEEGCIKAKELLSCDDTASIFLTMTSVEITRTGFEKLIKEYVDETMDKVTEAIGNAGLKPSDIDKVLLVGGSCRIPYIKRRLVELVGDKVVDDVDPDLAVVYGATQDNTDCMEDADDYYGNEEFDKALKIYTKFAQQGEANAQYRLGLMYGKGRGVSEDTTEAMKWYQRAAQQGYEPAQQRLDLLKNNLKTADDYYAKNNYIKAHEIYYKLAQSGDVDAQFKLGLIYEQGKGVALDNNTGIKWYRKAAEQGHVDAQCRLGYFYESGIGVQQNIDEAVKWYDISARKGNQYARNRVVALNMIKNKTDRFPNQNFNSQIPEKNRKPANISAIKVWSAINLFCCWPLAAVSFFKLTKANKAPTQKIAQQYIRQAKTACLVGSLFGCFIWIILLSSL